MELADECQTRSQTVQNEQFASECASLFPPSECWLSILRGFQINALAFFFLLHEFPFNQSCLLDSNTITCSGISLVP